MRAFAVIALAFVAAPASGAERVLVAEGTSVTRTVPFTVTAATCSHPSVVAVARAAGGRAIELVGKSRGRALCLVEGAADPTRNREYEIDVISAALFRKREYFVSQIGDIEGVDVGVRGDVIVIAGDVELETELLRIEKLASASDAENFVRLSSNAVRRLAREGATATPTSSPVDVVLEAGRATIVWLPFDPGTGVSAHFPSLAAGDSSFSGKLRGKPATPCSRSARRGRSSTGSSWSSVRDPGIDEGSGASQSASARLMPGTKAPPSTLSPWK